MDPVKPKPDYRKPKQIFVVCSVIALTSAARLIFGSGDGQTQIIFAVLLVGALAGMGIMWRDMKRENTPPPGA